MQLAKQWAAAFRPKRKSRFKRPKRQGCNVPCVDGPKNTTEHLILHLCVCVVYVLLCACTYVSVHSCVLACAWLACVHVCLCVYMCLCMCVCESACVLLCACMCLCVCLLVHELAHMCICVCRLGSAIGVPRYDKHLTPTMSVSPASQHRHVSELQEASCQPLPHSLVTKVPLVET